METGQNEGVAKLLDVEKTSDVYLTGLCKEMKDLREKLEEEKIINVQLQDILCGLEGRVAVYYQRAEELGTDNLKEMMNRAAEELAKAKEESKDLSEDIFNGCNYMFREVRNETGKEEEMRVRFKSIKSIEKSTELESARCEHVKTEILNLENELLDTAHADKELVKSMQVYNELDGMTLQFMQELDEIDDEITGLRLLQERRSNSSASK